MQARGQNVPEGGEVVNPTARTPEGCVAWGCCIYLFMSLEEGQQPRHVSRYSFLSIPAFFLANAYTRPQSSVADDVPSDAGQRCKCWPPSGLKKGGDTSTPRHAPLRGTRRGATHFVPSGDVLAYGHLLSQKLVKCLLGVIIFSY